MCDKETKIAEKKGTEDRATLVNATGGLMLLASLHMVHVRAGCGQTLLLSTMNLRFLLWSQILTTIANPRLVILIGTHNLLTQY